MLVYTIGDIIAAVIIGGILLIAGMAFLASWLMDVRDRVRNWLGR